MNIVKDSCPWCGSIISRDKFKEIEANIRDEEQKKLKAVETDLRRRFEADKHAAEKRIRDEADKSVKSLTAQLKQTLERLEQSEASKSEVYKQAQRAAEQRARQERNQEIKNLRSSLEKDRDQRLLKQQEEFHKQLEASQKKADDLSRQLQQKSLQEVEGSTINVFEELQEFFPEDNLTYFHAGEPNEKILHEVIYKGTSCGRIILDSRNRQAWQNCLVSKLRIDQVKSAAEHAILTTTIFPKGKKELCIEDDVIVINPGRAVHLVNLLRVSMIKMHVQNLSMVDRTSKTNLLYEFISSQEYAQKCGEADLISEEILELDVDEVTQHRKVWEKRGSLAKRLKAVLRDIETNISVIIEDGSGGQLKADTSSARSQRHLRKVL
jgi:hypothetical protein